MISYNSIFCMSIAIYIPYSGHECALFKVDRLLNSAKTVAMETFQVESCVRGHHIYKDVWSLGEVLQCTCELENTKDRYAVTVVRIEALLLAVSPARLQLQLPCS